MDSTDKGRLSVVNHKNRTPHTFLRSHVLGLEPFPPGMGHGSIPFTLMVFVRPAAAARAETLSQYILFLPLLKDLVWGALRAHPPACPSDTTPFTLHPFPLRSRPLLWERPDFSFFLLRSSSIRSPDTCDFQFFFV